MLTQCKLPIFSLNVEHKFPNMMTLNYITYQVIANVHTLQFFLKRHRPEILSLSANNEQLSSGKKKIKSNQIK